MEARPEHAIRGHPESFEDTDSVGFEWQLNKRTSDQIDKSSQCLGIYRRFSVDNSKNEGWRKTEEYVLKKSLSYWNGKMFWNSRSPKSVQVSRAENRNGQDWLCLSRSLCAKGWDILKPSSPAERPQINMWGTKIKRGFKYWEKDIRILRTRRMTTH
jgi:hypothetical protein